MEVEIALRQALALHQRSRSLHKELKSAEIALAETSSEESFAHLREIQTELAGLEGREAAAEGFGASQGSIGSPGRLDQKH
jgi:DNA primase